MAWALAMALARCSLCLVLLLAALSQYDVASAAVAQRKAPGLEPSRFVRFDDILSRRLVDEAADKKVFKRDADDFSIVDNEEEAIEASLNTPEAQEETSVISEQEDISDKDNEIEDSSESKRLVPKIAAKELTEDSDREKAVKYDISSTIEAEAVVEVSEESVMENMSAENLGVETFETLGKNNDSSVMGYLNDAPEGSGDDGDSDYDSEVEYSKETIPKLEEVLLSKNISSPVDELTIDNKSPLEVVETTTIDISIKEEELFPDERPIPNPIDQSSEEEVEEDTAEDVDEEEEEEGGDVVTAKPGTTMDPLKVDELIQVTTVVLPVLTDVLEGSAFGETDEEKDTSEETQDNVVDTNDKPTRNEGGEETKSTSEETEYPAVPFVPVGRNFDPLDKIPTEPPSGAESDADEESDDTLLKKSILTGDPEKNNEKGINELGVQNEDEITDGDERPSSSSGSYIVLGAIMVTIVVLLAYTVVKSRRQKRKRRSIEQMKAAEEDPGREMKEVDKLLTLKPVNGFSHSNGGPKEDDRLRQDQDDSDGEPEPEELTNRLNGAAKKDADQLSDVIVENVPRLNTAPMVNGNGTAPPVANGTEEDDRGSWVYGNGNALESTKIKTYIDEDSIPKTPIVIFNGGSTSNKI